MGFSTVYLASAELLGRELTVAGSVQRCVLTVLPELVAGGALAFRAGWSDLWYPDRPYVRLAYSHARHPCVATFALGIVCAFLDRSFSTNEEIDTRVARTGCAQCGKRVGPPLADPHAVNPIG